ncbi:MAG TPA: transporter [Gemmataceae bacterium]|nr:transporter [Gemmataceae bacterium]
MTKRSPWWVAILAGLLFSLTAAAEEDPWRPVKTIPPSAGDAGSGPAVTLECPRSLDNGVHARAATEPVNANLAPVSFQEPTSPPLPPSSADPPPPDDPPTMHTVLQPPEAVASPPTSGPVPLPSPGDAPVNQGLVIDKPLQHSFWDRCKDFVGGCCGDSANGRCLFQSDHSFDYFASPVTNPFLFEDPRALTEVKPLFIYAGAPSTNPIFKGGNEEYYGIQARLAITDRLSLTINELGFMTLNPFDSSAGPPGKFSQDTGFAQVTLGPKYTFLRSEEWKFVMAGGLLFQIPAGSSKVFQDTGTLGMVPYVSAAKNFCLPAGWGSTNLMGTMGYDFSVTNQRSQFYYMNLHWDYNIANTNMFYPFLEMSWFHYTQGGNANVPGFGFEGLDLVNFGSSNVGARDFLGISPGLRFKLNEHIQAGAAVTWPLLQQKEINDYTLTFDIIFRY